MPDSPSVSVLYRLRELVPQLPVPTFQDITLESDPDHVELDMIDGVGYGFNLLYLPGIIGVARWYSNAGAIFPKHSHPELEIITVYSGELVLQIYDAKGEKVVREECLYPGVSYTLEANTPHDAYFSIDTWYIAMTVPANSGWPHG